MSMVQTEVLEKNVCDVIDDYSKKEITQRVCMKRKSAHVGLVN